MPNLALALALALVVVVIATADLWLAPATCAEASS